MDVPDNLKTNLLDNAWNVDVINAEPTFTWTNPNALGEQRQYHITIYNGIGSGVVAESSWLLSSQHTSVVVDTFRGRLAANHEYSWRVEVKYANGRKADSDPKEFATAPGSSGESGNFTSSDLLWTKESSVATLTRAKATLGATPRRALLTVTALDTEAARRHVFNVYVDGTEVGVGPNRRSGNTVFFNTYDVTSRLSPPVC